MQCLRASASKLAVMDTGRALDSSRIRIAYERKRKHGAGLLAKSPGCEPGAFSRSKLPGARPVSPSGLDQRIFFFSSVVGRGGLECSGCKCDIHRQARTRSVSRDVNACVAGRVALSTCGVVVKAALLGPWVSVVHGNDSPLTSGMRYRSRIPARF